MKKFIASLAAVIILGSVSSLMAVTYDTLDDMNAVGTWTAWGTNVNLTSPANSGFDGTQPALVFNYQNTSGGDWLGFTKASIGKDWTNLQDIRFWLKGTGTANPIEVQLNDASGKQIQSPLTQLSNNAAWVQVTLPRASFSTTAGFDWAHIDKVEFIINGVAVAGAGTVSIDKLEEGMPDPVTGNSADVTVTVLNPSVSVSVTGSVAFGTILAGQTVVSANAITVKNTG